MKMWLRKLLRHWRRRTPAPIETGETAPPQPITTMDEYFEVFARRPGAGADEDD